MSMWKKISEKIFKSYEERSVISVKDAAKISANGSYIGAKILGDVEILEGVKITKGARINGTVKIGKYTSINGPNTDILTLVGKVEIGNFTSIARNVSIQEFNHFSDRISTYYVHQNLFKENVRMDVSTKGDIIIGHDVWIGTQCVILSGAKIGNGAIIAANSVVSGEIPPYAVAAGSPAKVIKYRFSPALIERINNLNWWDWPMEKILRNKKIFSEKASDIDFNAII